MKNIHVTYITLLFSTCLLLAGVNGCKKEPAISYETGTVTDVEGNVYKTVKIGNQWWMAENLKATKYRNGNPVPQNESNFAEWAVDTEGAWCTGLYGVLYNWYVVSNEGTTIAPDGWHVATDDEWKELEQHLGMSKTDADKMNWRGTNEGDKLKRDSVGYWIQHKDVWANNESGFSALAGNCRLFNGGTGEPFGTGYTGFWWSASENQNNNQAWYRHLDYKNANVFRFYGPKTYGFSIRCVKD